MSRTRDRWIDTHFASLDAVLCLDSHLNSAYGEHGEANVIVGMFASLYAMDGETSVAPAVEVIRVCGLDL